MCVGLPAWQHELASCSAREKRLRLPQASARGAADAQRQPVVGRTAGCGWRLPSGPALETAQQTRSRHWRWRSKRGRPPSASTHVASVARDRQRARCLTPIPPSTDSPHPIAAAKRTLATSQLPTRPQSRGGADRCPWTLIVLYTFATTHGWGGGKRGQNGRTGRRGCWWRTSAPHCSCRGSAGARPGTSRHNTASAVRHRLGKGRALLSALCHRGRRQGTTDHKRVPCFPALCLAATAATTTTVDTTTTPHDHTRRW